MRLDRTLEHSLTYALIEIGDPAGTQAGLTARSLRTKRAALIALDQMTPPSLDADTVVPLLDSPNTTMSKTAWWIAGRHRDWGSALRGYFDERLARSANKAERDGLVEQLTQFSTKPCDRRAAGEPRRTAPRPMRASPRCG